MGMKTYKLYQETGYVPWFKASTLKRFYETKPTYEQVAILEEHTDRMSLWFFGAMLLLFLEGIAIGVLL